MRLVIDLQACQGTGNRVRGIGRYSRLLAQAMLRQDRGHDTWLVLNGGMPEHIEEIRGQFDALIAQDRILVWDNPFPAAELHEADPWRCRVAEVLREDFLRELRPDAVHVASLFEGWNDPASASIGRGSAPPPPTAVTLYDLIPLALSEVYLQDRATRLGYERKLEDLRRADLCLAISEFTRRQAMDLLGLDGARIVDIGGSVDPVFRRLPEDPRRREALARRHGLTRPFVMYTGGFDARKNIPGLVRAYAGLPDALRADRQLAIVGQPPPAMAEQLQRLAQDCGLAPDDLRITGFIPDEDLVGLYNQCELYVFPSLLEGFGLPALEAMACGAPVIGADASALPEVIGHREAMFAAGSDEAMRGKIAQALADPGFRERLRVHGAEQVARFCWERSAGLALDALEALAARHTPTPAEDRGHVLARQSHRLDALVPATGLPRQARRRLAAAQSENLPAPREGRQLLVDVSNLSQVDAGTGIQRVVRNLLRELPALVPADLRVVPVRFDEAGVARHARAFEARFAGLPAPDAPDPVLDARPGDVFLGLDLSAHIVPWFQESFDRLRRRGVAMHFVVYDLIPLLRPDCVDPAGVPTLQAWYRSIVRLADGLCCISAAVADELARWCDGERPPRARPLRIGHFHLGAELDGGEVEAPARMAAPRQAPVFLMVGTLEPRKGHAQALDAFEHLWAAGDDAELVIVGKQGWMMDALAERLRAHPEAGRRLHWHERVDDDRLRQLYAESAALLVPSEAEGFGLPIVEAARLGLPVIARDLPVFVELAGAHARYFHGYAPEALAAAIRAWRADAERGSVPDPRGIACIDWRESARQLLGLVLGRQWPRRWQPGSHWWFSARDDRLGMQVGRLERDERVTAEAGGFLVHGPGIALDAGAYRLRLLGEWGPDSDGARLEIASQSGRRIHAQWPLSPDPAAGDGVLAEVEFELEAAAEGVEFRLWVSPATALALRGMQVDAVPGA